MKKIALIIFCLIFLVGCTNNNEDNSSKDKIIAELEYCHTRLVDILNNLNNISLQNYELISQKVQISQETEETEGTSGQSQEGGNSQSSNQSSGQSQEITVTEMQAKSVLSTDTNNIDWEALRSEIEVVNEYWDILMLDLYNAKVSNDDIINFANTLDECTLNINAEDKNTALSNLSILYAYIPKFLNVISAETSLQNIRNTQSNTISAYVSANIDDWESVNTHMINAENSFISVLNDIEFSKNREYKVNKTYMAIKDMQNAVKTQDKSLLFLKYKNLMENLNTL